MFACIFRVDFRKEQFQHKVARQKERKEEEEREREETEERLEALREKVLHFSGILKIFVYSMMQASVKF